MVTEIMESETIDKGQPLLCIRDELVVMLLAGRLCRNRESSVSLRTAVVSWNFKPVFTQAIEANWAKEQETQYK